MSNKFLLFVITFFSVHQCILHAAQREEYLTVSQRVESYFAALNSSNWLENSNKIGVGYNPLYGSPVCYTGNCQMEGFRRSIFKLRYLQTPYGSCTQKLIPEHVELDCLPSTTWDASTETITTLQKLHESIANKVEISASVDLQGTAFAYKTSVETRYMVDNIIQKQRIATQTSAQISYVKLSMFEPQMELSDDFLYVISNLPCCNYNTDVEQYIYEYIFNYFGFTYLSEILLGGIAQETIFVSKESYETMTSQSLNIENEAKVSFYISISATQSYNYNQVTHNIFMSEVQEKHTTTLGGDTSITTIDRWSATVPSNPVIIKFSIRHIFGLLTQRRFPNDSLIQNKSALIARALNNYLINQVYCYNNCTGHGICVSSSYFQFGICNCYQGYSGFDCSIQQVAPTPQNTQKPAVSRGTIGTFYSIPLLILIFLFSSLFVIL